MHQQRTLQRLLAVLAEAGDVELQDGAGPAVRRRRRFVAAGADVPVQAGFAVTEDGAGGVADGGGDGVVQPTAVAGRHQHLGVDAAERLGERVLDLGAGRVSHRFAVLSPRTRRFP